MINLKLKCTICGKEESNPDVIKEASAIIKKYNLKAEHYLSLINMMSGKCLDSDEHSFIFDETFTKQLDEIISKLKSNDVETETLRNNQRTLIKEIKELEVKLDELKSKEKSNEQRLQNIHKDCELLRQEVKDSTGSSVFEIW